MGALAQAKERYQSWRSGRQNGPGSGADGTTANADFSVNTDSPLGNKWDFEAMRKGDFNGIVRATPEQLEGARRTAKEIKEQARIQPGINAAHTEAMGAAARIFKSEQYHNRERLKIGVDAREEWVKTQEALNEKIKPGLHEQNHRLGLSQSKGQMLIANIDAEFAQRRADLQQLRRSR